MTRARTYSREFMCQGVELTPELERDHAANTSRVQVPLPALREITREVAVEAFDPMDILITARWRRPRVLPLWLVVLMAVTIGLAVGCAGAALIDWGSL